MNSNKLMLNTDKTEIMPIGSANRLGKIDSSSAKIGDSDIPFNASVKYLGVTLDQTLSFHDQITNVCRAAFIEIRRISSIRRCLSISSCSQLVYALITSRLDYCNFIYAGLPNKELARLQLLQTCTV